jgi:hypothetical protein
LEWTLFVITADQVGSRHSPDLVASTITRLDTRFGTALALPVDRNAGDELQALVLDPKTAVAMTLELTRGGDWSVGLGAGAVELPLAASTRESRGPAFIAARSAVSAAKKSPSRFAFRVETTDRGGDGTDFDVLMTLLLSIRERRTPQGWEVYDLLEAGQTQKGAAEVLGITPQAVSDRMSVAQVRIDLDAHAPLARLLARVSGCDQDQQKAQVHR